MIPARHTTDEIVTALLAAPDHDFAHIDLDDGGVPYWSLRIGRVNYWFANHGTGCVDFTLPGISDVTDRETARARLIEYFGGAQ
jgi:hypothetical protein